MYNAVLVAGGNISKLRSVPASQWGGHDLCQ